jgi:hypothetical protein
VCEEGSVRGVLWRVGLQSSAACAIVFNLSKHDEKCVSSAVELPEKSMCVNNRSRLSSASNVVECISLSDSKTFCSLKNSEVSHSCRL